MPRQPTPKAAAILAASLFLLAGCLPDGSPSPQAPELVPESSTGTVSLEVRGTGLAARALAPEPGGRLFAEIRLPSSRPVYRDSVDWNGFGSTTLRVAAIPEGRGYQAIVVYRDPQGLATHADTVRDLEVRRTGNTTASATLRPLLGRIQLSLPSVPSTVDSVGLVWESSGRTLRTEMARGPSGRTVLRLDSLAVGSVGILHVRAWTTSNDTLYFADTSATIASQADQSLSIKLKDARGLLGVVATFLPGGETDAVARFPEESLPSGHLLLAALSDSGSSDWILLSNPSRDSIVGPVRIARGTEILTTDLRLAPGEQTVLTRASCGATGSPSHPLHGVTSLACGLDLSVSWSSSGTLWEIRTPDGRLADQVLVFDGRQGWPDLNTSTSRTARLRTGAPPADASLGRSWCADDRDSPLVACH